MPPLTPADIEKIYQTDGAAAADAALQRSSRAREAEAAEAEAAYLRGLASEFNSKTIEQPIDLDASTGEVPIDEVEREKADTAVTEQSGGAEVSGGGPPVKPHATETHSEPTRLPELIRAARIKIAGGIDIAPDDPLAKDKRKVANALKKVGRTLADLPANWDTLPRIAKIPGERSRQNELFQVLEEATRQAKERRELEKRGRPANYHLLPLDQRKRLDANIRQRRHRSKIRTHLSKPALKPLPVAYVAPDSLRSALVDMSRRLEGWASWENTPRSRQLRNKRQQMALIRAAATYAHYFAKHNRPPTHNELAKYLKLSRHQTRRRLNVLKSLYADGGPWASIRYSGA